MKRILAVIFILLFGVKVWAQSSTCAKIPLQQVFTISGVSVQIVPGSSWRFCSEPASGTTCTPLVATIYSDPACANPISNPTTADQFGNPPTVYAVPANLHVQITGPGISQVDVPYIDVVSGNFSVPSSAGFTTNANGQFGYDTTLKNWHFFGNSVDNLNVMVPVSQSITNNDCVKWVNSGGTITVSDNAGPCASSISVVANNFLTSYNATTGVFTQAQPAFSNLSGQITLAQMANLGTTTTVLHGNAAGNPSFAAVGSSDLSASLALVTPNIGAATGTSLNLGATGTLSTTAQSGTGSICMTVNCAMTTPSLGSATATGLSVGSGGVLSATTAGTGISITSGTSTVNYLLATGGSLALVANASGSNFTLTLPLATDTLVGKATTDTLTNKTISSPAMTGAFCPDCGSVKHVNKVTGCTTAAAAGATCTDTVTWTTTFADAAYHVICNGVGITSGVPLHGGITAVANGSVTFQTVAGTAAVAQYNNIQCFAEHN